MQSVLLPQGRQVLITNKEEIWRLVTAWGKREGNCLLNTLSRPFRNRSEAVGVTLPLHTSLSRILSSVSAGICYPGFQNPM